MVDFVFDAMLDVGVVGPLSPRLSFDVMVFLIKLVEDDA